MSENTDYAYAKHQPDKPVGTDYNPRGDNLTAQEAVNRIDALCRKARHTCYLPEDPDANNVNAGRVRALAQALALLERAGIKPEKDLKLNDQEEMVPHE